MFKLMVMVLLCLMLSGCTQSSQVEDQAYVLVMGLDRTEDQRLQLTVQIPKISGSGGESGGGSEQGNYMPISVTADDYEAALEKLSWAATRETDLAQVKLIVLSRDLAESLDCRRIIEHIAQTERLYTATRIAVCEGEAKKFVEEMRPNIGTRISTDIDSMFEHYTSKGYIPESRLAELYYQTESVYSDPMVAYALYSENSKKEEETQNSDAPAAALGGSLSQISSDYEADISTRYLGAALFDEGRMCGLFTGNQTIMANLIRSEVESFLYECDGQSLTIVPTRAVRTRIDTDTNPVQITIDAKLSISSQQKNPDEHKLRKQLQADIRETIETARQLNVEPFEFAETAARGFLTMEEWQRYDWMQHFHNAEIKIKLSFAYSNT